MLVNIRLIVSLAGLLGFTTARRGPCRDKIVCVDGVNECGEKYSGCYNTCSPADSPTPPPCKRTSTTTSDDCHTRTVCIDGVNGCGMAYGTCIPDCTPWDITTPPCPTMTTTKKPSTTSECSPGRVCEDYIDPCGQAYGGCYDSCKESPTWTTPYCSLNEPTTTPIDTLTSAMTDKMTTKKPMPTKA